MMRVFFGRSYCLVDVFAIGIGGSMMVQGFWLAGAVANVVGALVSAIGQDRMERRA